MDSEWKTDIHPGYRTKVVKIGNATVEIKRPILTDEERRKREEQVKDALIHFERSVCNGKLGKADDRRCEP